MPIHSRGERLAGRYPPLAAVPEEERPGIVRAAIRHPVFLLLVAGGGLVLLPPYFSFAFSFLGIEREMNMPLATAKLVGAVLLPALVAVPLLSRFVMAGFIRREMLKRGYSSSGAPGATSSAASREEAAKNDGSSPSSRA